MKALSKFSLALVLWAVMPLWAQAADPGETRCGATGMVEEYQCFGTSCQWRNKFQRCANTNQAPSCNAGDTKCGADGYVQNCVVSGGETRWQGSFQRCAADRDPADNAPPGYGGNATQPRSPPPSYGGNSGNVSEPRVCTLGEQECGDDRHNRRCVIQGGKPAWQTVPGSRCGGQAPGMRN